MPTCTQCSRNALAALLPQALRVSANARRGAAAYGDADRLPNKAKMLDLLMAAEARLAPLGFFTQLFAYVTMVPLPQRAPLDHCKILHTPLFRKILERTCCRLHYLVPTQSFHGTDSGTT